MKLIYITLLVSSLAASTVTPKFVANVVPKNMSVQTKKKRFYALVAPAVKKVYSDLMKEYLSVAKDMKNGKNKAKIAALKTTYNVKTDNELLACLKPHPQSIALAQAAMESSWATSRFFVKAYNIFGVWSTNKNEPRIAANEKRGGKRTIWLRKFNSVEASVKAYYRLMARGKAYKEFRALRLKTNDPHQLVKKLDKYSEIGAKYGKELSQVIRFNKLVKYD
ncbi:hypothetical protein GJV85_12670 [Sulfurimonas aquatica]|uniref:Mannosyl-glycoprotein endo-beta-N-acetylglucosamidase-like domain-containing protein n=1 Tax=Sulfurimonas aquatica TaxID=2672570 RepID=A0A975GE04_9BACT|nr:glucosaminidase domain-containing protein [Sulfurimonas aquatica]QSZ42923.1 hypothetical protein GJV85_12670 [Sulfurimonas aquatica]